MEHVMICSVGTLSSTFLNRGIQIALSGLELGMSTRPNTASSSASSKIVKECLQVRDNRLWPFIGLC